MTETKPLSGAEEIHWDLSDLYNSPDDPAVKEDISKIKSLSDEFAEKYRGKFESFEPADLKEALAAYEVIYELLSKIGSYAYLNWTTNTEDPALGKMVQETNELSSEISQKLIFFDLEWLALPEEEAQKFFDAELLSNYRHYLVSSRKYKPYMLTEPQEQVMSAKSVTGARAWVRYFDETLGAARFDLDDESLTEQEVLSKLHEADRALRERAAISLTDGLKKMSRTLTFIFNTLLADKSTNDRLRGYDNWVSSRNLSNEISDEAVESLVTSVTNRYDLAQRYYKLKKSLLGVDELRDYDRYAPILENEARISWDEARDTVLKAYEGFHPEMGAVTRKFFDHNWIDAAIRPGKRGGAYSASTVPSVHPYVFMNYDGRIRDVQTLAHELGHGVHQYLSREQGILQANTPLTTAETASVFGEMLVFRDLLDQLDDEREKLALLIGKIDDTMATVFRQISMNRFEDAIHKARRNEGELSKDRFNELWMETQKEFYGDSVVLSDHYQHWWSYIPHFLHTPGYVYAYAFGELLVLALYESYKAAPEGFADRYLNLLRAGGSDAPEALIGKMGIDITSADFWNQGIGVVEQMINEAEELAASLAANTETE